MSKLSKVNILGVDITNASKEEVLEYILGKGKGERGKEKIYTPNPEMVVLANKDSGFKTILNNADIAITDGIGLVLAGRLLGKPLKEKISGIDLMFEICERASVLPVNIGLLGARDGVAVKAAECLLKKYPGLNIVFTTPEWPSSESDIKSRFKIHPELIGIQDSRFKKMNKEAKFVNPKSLILNPVIDILFVAYGVPKQEKWIAENIEKIPVRVAMGVGGAFDIISGDIKRAPKFVQKLGLEWLYRLIREPWRWKRQLALLVFIKLVIKEKLNQVNTA